MLNVLFTTQINRSTYYNRLTGKEKQVGGFDLIWDDGPVMVDEGGLDCLTSTSYSTNSFLGKSFTCTQLAIPQELKK